MIRIAVIDDENQERETLTKYFSDFQKESAEKFEIDQYDSGEDFLEEKRKVYDLICLDIDMKEIDGIQTAKMLREQGENAVIIFITNMAQMAIRGYEVQAYDFIIKPLNYYSFSIKLRNVIEIIHSRKVKNIVISTNDGTYKISTEDLLFVEVEGHNLYFHTKSRVYKQNAALKDVEHRLEGLSFKRCNHCYLVNLQHVSSVNRQDEVKVGDVWLKISRPRKKDFLQSLADYMGGIL